jgi:ABC-type Na+ transport system ATPase subunit NatA
MQEGSAGETYRNLINKHQAHLKQLLQKRNRLGWGRLFVFLLTAFIAYQLFVSVGLAGIIAIAIGFGVLLYLISLDTSNNIEITNCRTLIKINEEELEILQDRYAQRENGNSYAHVMHDYANDLDLFGPASLFQWLNRCYTEQGRELLAQNLLHPLPVSMIRERQEAIKEITPEIEWRQQLQSYALQTPVTIKTQEKAAAWLKEKDIHFKSPAWKPFYILYSFITLGSLVATIFGYIPVTFFTSLYLLYFTISIILSRNTAEPYVQLSGIVEEITTLHYLVKWIEDKPFHSPLLNQFQQQVRTGGEKAADNIKDLKKILDRFDLRVSIVGRLFFNTFLLWDVRQMIALNEWRNRNRDHLNHWFDMVASMEVLHTLATIHFNHPGWAFPVFVEKHLSFNGKDLGHPLIPATSRVTNDFAINGTAVIGLVTGSNMAGKSTFLRSIGVNVVLAQAGGPVCASNLALSPVQLMSSMRIADNLAENTSTFYAELKKLKTIIEAVNRHEPVFILLDEILRGTNSLDRHKGSQALIAQLVKQNAVAVIATHDLELAKMENQFPGSIENYHFDVQVEGEELYFDYKLKEGVCTSLNASILMKKIGIELQ